MPNMSETVAALQQVLREYIEATYHISHPKLVARRAALLLKDGAIYREPYIESTPRYQTGAPLSDLGLAPAATEVLRAVASTSGGRRLVYDPLYRHQGQALQAVLKEGRSILVTTGTGSGKTECFTLPILGKLAALAQQQPQAFRGQPAVRALVLYPMNALVNDQLGRLRLLFGDRRVTERFIAWSGRPARFAMYTGRAPYPGVRDEDKDKRRLKWIRDYFVKNQERADDEAARAARGEAPDLTATKLVSALKERGKWPAKPNLRAWYGNDGQHWLVGGQFARANTLPHDPELITRHEVQSAPPDVLVTNYSMLEFMLMRPLERPIFEATRRWLRDHPEERFLLVIDEAHLYHGAMGAEVALLVRRLRARLELPAERMQVICTSASFDNVGKAKTFAATLAGKDEADFDVITGTLATRDGAGVGDAALLSLLEAVDLERFNAAAGEAERLEVVSPLLEALGAPRDQGLEHGLAVALSPLPAMGRLINETMQKALRVDELGTLLFPGLEPAQAHRGAEVLLALGSAARRKGEDTPLLPCRVHAFFRGLPGLWACLDPNCASLPVADRGGPAGALYGQPRAVCDCGARVFELFTCRACGTAYARGYTDDLDAVRYLWPEPGSDLSTLAEDYKERQPVDVLLEPPLRPDTEERQLDLLTGRLKALELGERTRRVWLRSPRTPHVTSDGKPLPHSPGLFIPCGVCGARIDRKKPPVQDHQTKGDQPFQALVAKQLQVQAVSNAAPSDFAPLQGRKVLVFSDSRQVAARLAPNLQQAANKDALRALIVDGFRSLSTEIARTAPAEAAKLHLDDLYLAVLVSAARNKVRLRITLSPGEVLHQEEIAQKLAAGVEDWGELRAEMRPKVPAALLLSLQETLFHKYYGLRPLALGSLRERAAPAVQALVAGLPSIPGVAEDPASKGALVRRWLDTWKHVKFAGTPADWIGTKVTGHESGNYKGFKGLPGFTATWLPKLKERFLDKVGSTYYLKSSEVCLQVDGPWAYCEACKTTQRPSPLGSRCVECEAEKVREIDPDTNPVFAARKGYYRAGARALALQGTAPVPLIAAEHTAQLNGANAADVFSKAEENELLFQDIPLGPDDGGRRRYAIDVLSCTTTMEVGIDIGALSGVALRNLPPGRANYQQRAGRAGRRGHSVASVIAFGSADSHDEHYFSRPADMIRGPVQDPILTLDNLEIIRRHVTAFLLQRYLNDRIDQRLVPEGAASVKLFEVLGKVSDFRAGANLPNRTDLEAWLRENEAALQAAVTEWATSGLPAADKAELVSSLVAETLSIIDKAIGEQEPPAAVAGLPNAVAAAPTVATVPPEAEDIDTEEGDEPDDGATEPDQEDDGAPEDPPTEGALPAAPPTGQGANAAPLREDLMARLLSRGVIPRYAFPTDVTTFYVFDKERSTRFRPAYSFAAQQGLAVALSQYAPGKGVWIGDSEWRAGALYSPYPKERRAAWERRQLYLGCKRCGFAELRPFAFNLPRDPIACPACGGPDTFGPGMPWIRPPGFAHPIDTPAGRVGDDPMERSYATTAKLQASGRTGQEVWIKFTDRVEVTSFRKDLIVSNLGPKGRGFTYCKWCGVIEPTATGSLGAGHSYPKRSEPQICEKPKFVHGLALGTTFLTDLALFSIRAAEPVNLMPGAFSTTVALRTACEAISRAACALLNLEPGEVRAEFRPALTPLGATGEEAEIFLYDTLPGGAGFSRRAAALGVPLLERALALLTGCAEGCDSSCYRCLRSFRNRFEHHLLDRHLGAALLRYMVDGTAPTLDPARAQAAYKALAEDVRRQRPDLTATLNKTVTLQGVGLVTAPILFEAEGGERLIVTLCRPLTAEAPLDEALQAAMDGQIEVPVLPVDEAVVRGNLPAAAAKVLAALPEEA